MRLRRSRPMLGVVVPAYNIASLLPAALDSILGQTYKNLYVVVVDDGSTDMTGVIAEEYADRDPRVVVRRTANHGLGAARNTGLAHLAGADYITFADSDDVVPRTAYATMVRTLEKTGSDFVTGSVQRWEDGDLVEPAWMHSFHNPERLGTTAAADPRILGDVFAWNKVYRRTFWDSAALSWPEGLRYEDQPTLTQAYLAATAFDVIPDIVYHWRIRTDGTSITQQRSTVADLRDRHVTKKMSLETVRKYVADGGDPEVLEIFLNKTLPGDMRRYFAAIPEAGDEWWDLLVEMVRDVWSGRTFADTTLPPGQRLIGWLVEQDRPLQAKHVAAWIAEHGRVPRNEEGTALEVPELDLSGIDPYALRV
ncbi:glycosyltransferase family 2 protein [Nocardioides sp.]|uniref:glycosyltransferase family 2 protein n=1 Tax=Nocardioides sp. TaxID=35761 RepID=UPI0019CA0248|nr:glycosyltransferase family 2 protein [Nocardioides sp.]MBC7278054.1 glycosyltransferase family 2 protein [Nocardioides sp.]